MIDKSRMIHKTKTTAKYNYETVEMLLRTCDAETLHRLLAAGLAYELYGELPSWQMTDLEAVLWMVVQKDIDLFRGAWEKRSEARSLAGIRGAEARWYGGDN